MSRKKKTILIVIASVLALVLIIVIPMLLRARAIESQCWVVAANQWGRHFGARASYGHSMIVDPWGTVVAECSDRVGVVVAQLDSESLREVRAKLPSLQHRRLG